MQPQKIHEHHKGNQSQQETHQFAAQLGERVNDFWNVERLNKKGVFDKHRAKLAGAANEIDPEHKTAENIKRIVRYVFENIGENSEKDEQVEKRMQQTPQKPQNRMFVFKLKVLVNQE